MADEAPADTDSILTGGPDGALAKPVGFRLQAQPLQPPAPPRALSRRRLRKRVLKKPDGRYLILFESR